MRALGCALLFSPKMTPNTHYTPWRTSCDAMTSHHTIDRQNISSVKLYSKMSPIHANDALFKNSDDTTRFTSGS